MQGHDHTTNNSSASNLITRYLSTLVSLFDKRYNIRLIGDHRKHREGLQNPLSSSFRSKVTADCVSAVDGRLG